MGCFWVPASQEVISAASGAGLAAARVILDGGFPFFKSLRLRTFNISAWES